MVRDDSTQSTRDDSGNYARQREGLKGTGDGISGVTSCRTIELNHCLAAFCGGLSFSLLSASLAFLAYGPFGRIFR